MKSLISWLVMSFSLHLNDLQDFEETTNAKGSETIRIDIVFIFILLYADDTLLMSE